MRESEELIQKAQKVAFRSIQRSFKHKQLNEYKMRNELIDDVKSFLFSETERRPIILPVILTN